MRRRWLGLALALAAAAVVGFGPAEEGQAAHEQVLGTANCPEHPPIKITEDVGMQGFVLGPEVEGLSLAAPTYRPGSGVVSGTGSPSNPYVIENWCISSDPDGWPTEGPDQAAAIHIEDTSAHVLVEDNVLVHEGDFETGISIRAAENVRLVDNDISDHAHAGIHVRGSENVDVDGNRIADNGGPGLLAQGGFRVETRSNEILDNGGAGVRFDGAASSLVQDTTLTGNERGIAVAQAEGGAILANMITANDGTAIELEDANDVIVRGNEIDRGGSPDAIRLYDADGNTIEDNLVTRVANGIGLFVSSDDNVVEANTIRTTSGYGLTVSFSRNTEVRANTIQDNTWHGLRLIGTDTQVVSNTVTGNDAGIDVGSASDGARIEDNELSGNRVGIAVEGAAVSAIENNAIEANADAGLAATDLSQPVPAERNWWGHVSGPSGGVTDACTGAAADGDGQPIQLDGASVCFDPWLRSS